LLSHLGMTCLRKKMIMPNWCENNLSIVGKAEDMIPFLKVITQKVHEDNRVLETDQSDWDITKFESGDFHLLHTLYPTPEDLLIGDASFGKDSPQQIANKEKHGYADWYDWRINHWGCKWGETSLSIGQEYTVDSDGLAVIAFNFETPWGPPIEAFDKISKDYPKLVFCLYYEEPGMAFCGNNIWAEGEQKESEEAKMVSRWFDENYLYETYINNN
jgi:hypothetical protein